MFEPTHTIDGVPVMKVPRGGTGRAARLPLYKNLEGEDVRVGRSVKAIPIPGASAPVATLVKDPEPEPEPTPEHLPGDIVMFHPDIAAAIYRAAAWPTYGEAIGYVETARGDSVHMIAVDVARVCRMKPEGGGEVFNVRIPMNVAFEIAEDVL